MVKFLPTLKCNHWDFLDGPVVKTSPSNAGVAGSIPGQGTKIPDASMPKKKKDKVTNSIKTLKMIHIKKKERKNECHLKNDIKK